MFRWVRNLWSSQDPSRSLRAKLEARRQACFEALEDAENRGDCRMIGAARMVLAQATTDLLRAEVGR